jgi:hypothetical protein
MTIEDESTGFVFPAPRHNVAVNEWGLAKIMCRCNGIPAWSCRTAPKCRICKRKRAERRTEEEEEKQNIKQANEEASRMGGEGSSSIVKVMAADEDGGEQSNKKRNGEQVQVDEKGSGDMWATEKATENVVKEDSELPVHKDLRSSEPESRKGSRHLKEDGAELGNMLEMKRLKDADEKAFIGSDNKVGIEKRGRGNLEPDMKVMQTTTERKLKVPVGSEVNTAMEIDERGDAKAKEQNIGNSSLEASPSKNEKVQAGDSNETMQTEGNGEMSTPSEMSPLKDRKQRISAGIDYIEPKQTRVKVANKYKVNVKTPREVPSEVRILT